MSRVTTIYNPSDPELKENAQLLAELEGKSLSKYVWNLLEEQVNEKKDQINRLKEKKAEIQELKF